MSWRHLQVLLQLSGPDVDYSSVSSVVGQLRRNVDGKRVFGRQRVFGVERLRGENLICSDVSFPTSADLVQVTRYEGQDDWYLQ
jgi:hypothetical protein